MEGGDKRRGGHGRAGAGEAARVCAALGHPLRIRIVFGLSAPDTRLSPSQLAEHLEEPLPNVAYHVRMLVKAKLLRQAGDRQVRGAVEHFYMLASDGHRALHLADQLIDRRT
jgi:hypothetical protein